MIVEHNRPGDMQITLSHPDTIRLRRFGSCMVANEIDEPPGQMWVWRDDRFEVPVARILNGEEVHIIAPSDERLPLKVLHHNISAYMRTADYPTRPDPNSAEVVMGIFGEAGHITVR
jgi:hypothetical protein